MKKLLVVLVLLIAGTVFAQQTQNLGELAKKEKARREALEKQGKKGKVYTKEDLERVKDKLGIEISGATSPGEGAPEEQAAEPFDSEAFTEQLKAQAAKEQERADLETQLADLQTRKEDLQNKIDDNNTRTANGILSVNPAQTLQENSQLDSQMKDLDRQIQDLQQQIQDLDQPHVESRER